MANLIDYGLLGASLAIIGITALTVTVGIVNAITPAAAYEVHFALSSDLLDIETGIGTVPQSRATALAGLSGCGNGPPAFNDHAISDRNAMKRERRVEVSRPGCADNPAFTYTLAKDSVGNWVLDGDILPSAADAGKPVK